MSQIISVHYSKKLNKFFIYLWYNRSLYRSKNDYNSINEAAQWVGYAANLITQKDSKGINDFCRKVLFSLSDIPNAVEQLSLPF